MNAPDEPNLTVSQVVGRVASLASLPYQERWIVRGNKDEFLLANELIEDVYSLRYLVDRPQNASVLTQDQFAAVRALLSCMDNLCPKLPEWQSHAETAGTSTDPVWRALRADANTALKSFGLEVDELSIEDIDRL
jgi:hypothetical protein